MKSPAFDYVKPRSLDQVFALLKEYGDDARLLAGGQTLMATLNMRLSEPRLVIDITGLEALRGIALQGPVLRIGALATHTEIEQSALVRQHAPLLSEAAPHIAHRAIRNSGTWGGSIAYADPAAEWPACLLALGGTAIGAMFGIQAVGSLIGPLVCGVIADKYGLLSAFWFLAITIIIANLLVFVMPQTMQEAEAKA